MQQLCTKASLVAEARRAFARAKALGLPVSYMQVRELVAAGKGAKGWNELTARLSDEQEPPALVPDGHESGSDFRMPAAVNAAWVGIGGISVYLRRNDEGVSVDLFARKAEDHEALAGTWLLFSEAEQARLTDCVDAFEVRRFEQGDDPQAHPDHAEPVDLFNCLDDAVRACERLDERYRGQFRHWVYRSPTADGGDSWVIVPGQAAGPANSNR